MSLENNKSYINSDAIYSLIESNPNITYEEYVSSKVEWYKSVFGDAKYAVDFLGKIVDIWENLKQERGHQN